jgi:glycosyltransferase involved in cell wall biosynthesis
VSAHDFTVLIALYNKRPFIRRTLETALAQHHPATEILIVDDGSIDGSVAQIEDLIGGSVRLIRQANAGPGPARNRGFAEARCDWVALLDADDLWLPDHLAELAGLIERFPEARVAHTAFARIPAGGEPQVPMTDALAMRGYLADYFATAGTEQAMWSSCVAIRRDAFAASGGYGAYWPGEDVELWAKLALAHPIAATRKVTALYTVETGGLMDQGSGTRFGVGEEPEMKVLQDALAEPRHAARHADVRSYLNRLLAQRVHQAFYAGDTRRARGFLRLLKQSGGARPVPYRVMSHLPAWIVRAGVGAYRKAKARRRG